MALNLAQVTDATRSVVRKAKRNGVSMSTLTPRIVRDEVAKLLEVDEDDLREFRTAIKQTAHEAAQEPRSEDDASEPEPSTPKLKKEVKGKSTSKPAKPVKSRASSEDASADSTSASKKRKRQSKSKAVYKSAEFIATSDIEHDEDDGTGAPSTAAAKLKPSRVDTSDEEDVSTKRATSSSSVKAKSAPKRQLKPKSAKQATASDDEAEVASENSSQSKSKPAAKSKAKPRANSEAAKPKAKRAKKEVDKDEETIKRLKSLVVACGVRKVWSKELAGLDRPSQQIKKIKEILTSLGMSGRMSMEQAKAIRAKRELAQEIEDVVNFEKAIVGRSRRSATQSQKQTDKKSDGEIFSDEEDSEGDDDEPKKKRAKRLQGPNAARKSITAFLGDDESD